MRIWSLPRTLTGAGATRMMPKGRVDGTITVVMTTYNHEKYIAEAITSVLEQTYDDFTFIIVNDGSTDATDAIIRGFRDRRIIYIRQSNQGESTAVNNGIARATGQYIALMDGDDVCHPQRLARQRDFMLSRRARAVTSWIELIDDESERIDAQHPSLALSNAPPCQSRAGIFRRLWFHNYLWPSSAMLERQLLKELGGFCPTAAQLQDHLLWIGAIKRTHIHTIAEPLIRYRIRSGEANVSRNPRNAPRLAFEMKQLYRGILDGLHVGLFREAFAEEIRDASFFGRREYAIEKAFLYLTHPSVIVREIGVEKLYALMQNRHVARILADHYRFLLTDFSILANDPTYRTLPWR